MHPLGLLRSLLLCIGFLSFGNGWAEEVKTSPPKSGRSGEGNLLPADVINRILWTSREMDHLCERMGVPVINTQLFFTSKGVSKREVYGMSLVMFEKMSRLHYEIERFQTPMLPKLFDPTASDIWKSVDQSLRLLLRSKLHLGARGRSQEAQEQGGLTWERAFKEILQLNQKISHVLRNRFRPVAPQDVYMKASQAVNTMGRILEWLRIPSRFPSAPRPSSKFAKEVYEHFMQVIPHLETWSKKRNLAMMHIDPMKSKLPGIHPSDVYDLASIVVFEMEYLHSTYTQIKAPLSVYYPGIKNPQDVFQKVSQLLLQLKKLDTRKGKRRWMKGG